MASGRILIADDDPVILRLLEVNFSLEGFDVETAERGERVLEEARRVRPDVIVLDVMMPGMDGWEVCERLKEDPGTADIPIMVLSARTQEQDRERGRELGVSAYVTKPFDPEELIRVARSLLPEE
ncbi:MAG TPA: response regulator [Actinomycetota bacterium]